MAEFDTFATNYRDLVDESVRLTGESSDYFAAYKAEYAARKVTPRTGGKILDYGCGVGLLSGHLRSRLPAVTIDGFDPSPDSIGQVDPSLLAQGTFTSKMEDVARSYDLIVLSNVLHHVKPAERRALVRDAASRLADGGKMIVFEHNPLNPLTRWAVSRCPFDEGVVLLPARETRMYCEFDRLRMLRQDYVVFFPHWLARLRPLEPVLGWCALGAQYAVVAEKLRS